MIDRAELIVLIVNLILGFGFAYPLARRISRLRHSRWDIFGSFLILIFLYFVESIGLTAGMATNIPGIFLAFVWGVIFGSWIRRSSGALKSAVRTAMLVSLYSSLPAVSLLTIPVVMFISGWDVLSSDSGLRFGVPAFVPWPMNTILGFCVFVATIGVVFKGLITTGIVYLMCRESKIEKSKGNGREIYGRTI